MAREQNHGVSIALGNNGNDGYGSIEEQEDGQVIVKIADVPGSRVIIEVPEGTEFVLAEPNE
jgi:predicted enzyme related to lactoylglutathione lyase